VLWAVPVEKRRALLRSIAARMANRFKVGSCF
jgi:hypothetical protein